MANICSIAKSIKSIDASCGYYAVVLLGIILLGGADEQAEMTMMMGSKELLRWPCDELYVVEKGETLHTISDKCGDPFIVERNPHIHDPDDVFPGLVIKITPYPSPTAP